MDVFIGPDNILVRVLENMSDGFISLDKNDVFLHVNQKAGKIIGQAPSEIIGKSFDAVFPDGKKTPHYALITKAWKEKTVVCSEECPPPYDNWYEIRVYPRNDVLDIYISNITNRILTEKVLSECERSKSVFYDNLPGMAYRRNDDQEYTMQFVSQGCYSLTGYNPASLLYNHDLSYKDLIDSAFRDVLSNNIAKAAQEKKPFHQEYRITKATGAKIWVLDRGQAIFNDKGILEAVEGLVFDISDRKKSEQDVEYLLNHDYLTGVNNREYFKKEISRLDIEEQLPLSILYGDINGLKIINNAFGNASGDKMIVDTARVLLGVCREKDVLCKIGGGQFCILMPQTDEKTADSYIQKIDTACNEYNQSVKNEMININISVGYATKDMPDIGIESVFQLAEENMYRRKLMERKSTHSSIVSSIQTTMLARSQETEEHAERLVALTRKLGMKLELAQLELNDLELLAALHDIGKVGVNDQILNKPGKLTDEEWVEMKKHSEIGYRIAMSSPELMPVAEFILSHHERWDGKGYPRNLAGEAIPYISRVLSVVDAFDAMTQDRSYRKALPMKYAFAEIKRNSGTQFDPQIASAFLEMLEESSDSIE